MKNLWLLLPFLLSLLQASGQASRHALPIQLKKNLILIEVGVNAGPPMTFVFDTGAGVTVIDRKAAHKLGLAITGAGRLATSGKSVSSHTSYPNSLHLGGITLPDISLDIISIQHLSDYLGHELDGVIGYDLLKTYVVEANIDSMQMRLYKALPGGPGPAALALEVIPMEFNHFGLELSVRPGKRSDVLSLPFKVDTAFEDLLVIHNPTLQKYSLLKGKKYKELRGFGAESTITTNYQGKFREVMLGGRSWKNVSCIFEVDPISIAARKNSQAAGLIGQELLLEFNITYDLPAGKIYLEDRG